MMNMYDKCKWKPCTRYRGPWQVTSCRVGRIDMWMFHDLYHKEGFNSLGYTGYKVFAVPPVKCEDRIDIRLDFGGCMPPVDGWYWCPGGVGRGAWSACTPFVKGLWTSVYAHQGMTWDDGLGRWRDLR